MLDNRKFPRGERFKTLGLINEPGFQARPNLTNLAGSMSEGTGAGGHRRDYLRKTIRGPWFPALFKSGFRRRRAENGMARFHERSGLLQRQQASPTVSRRCCLRLLSHRAYPVIRPRILKIRAGKISHRPSVISTSAKEKSLAVTWKGEASSTKIQADNPPAPPTRPALRRTTLIIPTRSIPSFFCRTGKDRGQGENHWRHAGVAG